MRMPVIIVTSDLWTIKPYVVFKGEKIGDKISDEIVNERREKYGYDDFGFNTVKSEMIEDFILGNSDVDWLDMSKMICGTRISGDEYDFYRYDNDGNCKYMLRGTVEEVLKEVQ